MVDLEVMMGENFELGVGSDVIYENDRSFGKYVKGGISNNNCHSVYQDVLQRISYSRQWWW